MQKTVRVSLAVVLSMLILLSALPLGAVSVSAETSNPYAATKMSIFDGNNKDITSNPIIYIDNSDAGGGATSTNIKVKIDNDAGYLDDAVVMSSETAQNSVKYSQIGVTSDSATYTFSAITVDKYGNITHLEPGTVKVTFTTQSGEVYRTLTVVVYDPAYDSKVYVGNDPVEFSKGVVPPEEFRTFNDVEAFYTNYGLLPDCGGILTVANHQYKLSNEFESYFGKCTDTVEWVLYDGEYNGTTQKQPGTSKAEISEDGIFTPKSNGTVTIVIKPKATETSDRATGKRQITPSYSLLDNSYPEPYVYEHYALPKYLKVVIVKENPARAMKITNAPTAMQANENFQLQLSMTPSYTGDGYESGATDDVTWESSNENVATVDKKGLVTAVAKGEVTITARGENNDVYASCKIRVLTKATSVTISPRSVSTRIGVGVELTATMSPDTADDEIVWTSLDTSIATVKGTSTEFTNTQNAVVTGVSEGATTIVAKAKNSGVEKRITVQVSPKNASDSLELSYADGDNIVTVHPDSTINLYTQKSLTVDAKLTAQDGSTSDDIVLWDVTGNGDDVVTFNNTNRDITLNGVSVGTVTVKVYSESNPSLTKNFYVRVLKACDDIELRDVNTNESVGSKSLNKGSSFTLKADLTIDGNYPYQHNDTIVSWSSQDTSVATVDNSGYVTGIKNGETYITAKSASGKTANCLVRVFTTSSVSVTGVTPPSDGVSLPTTNLTLDSNGEGKIWLGVIVRDENNDTVYNNDCRWTSSDQNIATVDNKGEVTGVAIGTTIITVKSGSKSESCLLYVGAELYSTEVLPIENVTYSPIIKEYNPKVVLKFNGKTLTEGTDYTVEYENNTSVGTATVKVIGKGNYTGETYTYFTISPKTVASSDVKISTIDRQECTGDEITPKPVITCEGVELKEDVDYNLYYSNNYTPGTATVTINGYGNYTGTVVSEFEIYCEHKNLVYEYRVSEPTCTEEGVDRYRCSACGEYIDKTIDKIPHHYVEKVVPPTYEKGGYTEHVCDLCGDKYKDNYTSALKKVSISGSTVKLAKTSYAYTGKAIKPAVTVKKGSVTLKKGTDYSVSYKNNKKTGKATVTITGKGGYSGTITKTFTIYPKKATLSSVKSTKKKQITAKWKKDTQATGYQLQYSTNSKFKSGNKTYNISKNSTVYKKLTTKKGKTYYVRVRSYKTISGKKVYGAWSSVKHTKSK